MTRSSPSSRKTRLRPRPRSSHSPQRRPADMDCCATLSFRLRPYVRALVVSARTYGRYWTSHRTDDRSGAATPRRLADNPHIAGEPAMQFLRQRNQIAFQRIIQKNAAATACNSPATIRRFVHPSRSDSVCTGSSSAVRPRRRARRPARWCAETSCDPDRWSPT